MIELSIWQPADGLTLEPNAMSAATEKVRSLALTAGPGAGKTELLAQRADFLLRTKLCRYPKRILAISFKVDASRNLKDRVKRRCGIKLSARFDSHTFHAFAKRIIDRFRPVLVGRDALNSDYQIGDTRVAKRQITFDDIVPLAITILKTSSAARRAVRQTYSDVFLDEFQDCTGSQYELVRIAFLNTPVRLTAVGDTKQRIMGFAGALEGIFVTFANDFDAVALNLYRNFRSQPRLIRMQNEIVRRLDPKAAVSDAEIVGNGGTVASLKFDDSSDEAIKLADMIEAWISDDNISPSEIAVLMPQQPDAYAELLMNELSRRKIPYRNEQSLQDLSSEPATRLIIDFLFVVYGEREPDAYLRLSQMLDQSDHLEDDVFADVDWQRYLRVKRTAARTDSANNQDLEKVWLETLEFLRKVGRDRVVALSPEYEQRDRLNEIVKDTKSRLSELNQKGLSITECLAKFSDDRSVRIMTIHKCKGLEFDSVILLGVEKETYWGNQDEKRCSFFVGISRARKRLVLTQAASRLTPTSPPKRWQTNRVPHDEFLSYASKFV